MPGAETFRTSAGVYDRHVGRYGAALARELIAFAGPDSGTDVLDVGCGPGALTAELVGRLGSGAVAAVDPSEPFVAAARERFPDVRIERVTESVLDWMITH